VTLASNQPPETVVRAGFNINTPTLQPADTVLSHQVPSIITADDLLNGVLPGRVCHRILVADYPRGKQQPVQTQRVSAAQSVPIGTSATEASTRACARNECLVHFKHLKGEHFKNPVWHTLVHGCA
jgi:hypothetical protein